MQAHGNTFTKHVKERVTAVFVYNDFVNQIKKGIVSIIAIINLVDNENISLDASLVI